MHANGKWFSVRRAGRSRAGFACVAALCSVGLGGACSATVDPIEVAPGCPNKPLRGPTAYQNEPATQLISDFESDTEDLAQVGGRTGAWIRGTDGTGDIFAEVSSQCSARGKFAGHFEGSNSTSWGSNWTAVFIATAGNRTAAAYDARAYSGISFWAAFGGNNGSAFAVPFGVTTMDNAWNGGICKVCMDFYENKVTLTRDWQRYVVRFADMAQAGWGSPLVAMRQDQMVGFIIWPQQQFDIWIDDVRFEP